MSEQGSEEKTEPASERKLKKAREKGNVTTSKDTISSLVTASALAYLFAMRDNIGNAFKELYLSDADAALPFVLQLKAKADIALSLMAQVLIPFFILVLVIGLMSGFMISGFVFSAHSLTPDFKKINPVSGFKKIFGRRALMTFLMHFIRVSTLMTILAVMFYLSLPILLGTPQCGIDCEMATFWRLLLPILIAIIVMMLVFAALDYAVQRSEFMREQKMSITEVKREYKDMEGDPHLNSQMEADQREMLDSPGGIAQATVVVCSGSKAAYAIRYVEGDTPAPVVVARGRGASGVAKLRRKAKTLVVEDDILVELLSRKGTGDYITDDPSIMQLAPHLAQAAGFK